MFGFKPEPGDIVKISNPYKKTKIEAMVNLVIAPADNPQDPIAFSYKKGEKHCLVNLDKKSGKCFFGKNRGDNLLGIKKIGHHFGDEPFEARYEDDDE